MDNIPAVKGGDAQIGQGEVGSQATPLYRIQQLISLTFAFFLQKILTPTTLKPVL